MSKYITVPIYTLTDYEAKMFYDFIAEHKIKMACNKDIRIEATAASGIGTNTWIKCICGTEKEITDYSAW